MDKVVLNRYYRTIMPSPRRNPSPAGPIVAGRAQTRDLVLSAVAGSTPAFHQLADRYQDAVYRLVYHRLRSQMDAEDLTQDVFFKAYRQLHKLKHPERFKSWLFSIALNRIRDHLRREKIKRLFGLVPGESAEPEAHRADPAAPDGFSQLGRRQFWDIVTAIVETMSAGEREVFLLRFIDQLGLAEMAQVLKKGESTVKTQLYRSIAKFRTHPESDRLKGLL